MGVAGSGKTTIGRRLAAALACPFLEGDTLHPPASLEAMQRGVPLTDHERGPWLDAVHARMRDAAAAGTALVVACSALKASYRARLERGLDVRWVYLAGEQRLIRERLRQRRDHFFPTGLLDSQWNDLEEPAGALVADVSQPRNAIVAQVLAHLGAGGVPRVFPDVASMIDDAAAACAAAILAAVAANGRCAIALSGGSTPIPLHRRLATAYRERIPWDRLHVFWGDERYVPHTDSKSNYRMARETLLDHVPVPAAQIHPMPTHFADPQEAAADYERTLQQAVSDAFPSIDLAIMGMGPDGHTASLFPHAPSLTEVDRWVLAVSGPQDSPTRLTLTIPVFAAAPALYFLVAGADKAEPAGRVLSGTGDPDRYPAAALQRAAPHATWWLDAAAAAQLTHSPRD